VEGAGVAFAGTVTNLQSERVRTSIVTRIVFSDVDYAKGHREGHSIVLTMNGGKLGNEGVFTIGLPEFEVHKRYIVLAKSDLGSERNGYNPVVYFNQGFFRVESEAGVGSPVIRDWAGRSVSAYRSGHLVVVGHSPLASQDMQMRDGRGDSKRAGLDLHAETTMGGDVAAEVVPSELDTGARYTEREFLDLIRRIATE